MPDVTTNVIHVDCDLSSFASVREAAAAVREAVGELDVLCLNAGVMGLLDAATPDGFDVQMQPNHLSQFLLTALLWVSGESRLRPATPAVTHAFIPFRRTCLRRRPTRRARRGL
mmetsp:Transcript_96545/g.275438  ORF Transcript_96545/g.275438 Transcript_96545/m.275438 type:complete len:114 (-) Transcript_96545:939-1280(-)